MCFGGTPALSPPIAALALLADHLVPSDHILCSHGGPLTPSTERLSQLKWRVGEDSSRLRTASFLARRIIGDGDYPSVFAAGVRFYSYVAGYSSPSSSLRLFFSRVFARDSPSVMAAEG
ncbi:hypothetical protein SAY86_024888 [Trapa natans]|uniref:Uncharacterized protein n=1 Tax=Trapa natans TaxID=22666 RepID=A0AAN7MVP4_TRANT|nr:hypothetical protein SAY86_024888 [Trapa natans]